MANDYESPTFTPQVAEVGPGFTGYDCLGETSVPAEEIPPPEPIVPPVEPPGTTEPPPEEGPETPPPHEPPENTLIPVITGILRGQDATVGFSDIYNVSVDDSPIPGDNLTFVSNATGILSGYLVVPRDNLYLISAANANGSTVTIRDISGFPATSYPLLATIDMAADTGVTYQAAKGFFYSEKTKRLYIASRASDNYIHTLSYDLSDMSSPVFIDSLQASLHYYSSNLQVNDDESALFFWRDGWIGHTQSVDSVGINSDGTFTSLLDTIELPPTNAGDGAGVVQQGPDKDWILGIGTYGNSDNACVSLIHISDPSNMTSVDIYMGPDTTYSDAGYPTEICSACFHPDGRYLYILSRKLHAADASDYYISVFDCIDRNNPVYVQTTALGIGSDPAGGDLKYIEVPDSALDPFMFLTSSGNLWTITVDRNDPLSFSVLDYYGLSWAVSLGYPGSLGRVYRTGDLPSSEPTPITANLGVVTGVQTGDQGFATILDLDDYSDPSWSVIIGAADLYNEGNGPHAAFNYNGDYLILYGPSEGVFKVYLNGASFGLVGSVTDSALVGGKGLVTNPFSNYFYTMVGNEIVEIDISDPANPVVGSSSDIGPSYLDSSVPDPTIKYATGAVFGIKQDGPGLVSYPDMLRLGWGRPIETVDVNRIYVDATYAYIWNNYNGGGLAIIDHTTSAMELVGYYNLGTAVSEAVAIAKSGDSLFVLLESSADGLLAFDVSDPTTPTLDDQFTTDIGAVGLAILSSTTLVVIGNTLQYLDFTTPSAISETSSLATGREILSGAVSNGKLVAFDNLKNAISYTIGSPIVEQDSIAMSTMGDLEAYGFTLAGQDYVAVMRSSPSATQALLTVIDVTTVTSLTIKSQLFQTTGDVYRTWGLDTSLLVGIGLGYQSGEYQKVSTALLNLANPGSPILSVRVGSTPQEFDRDPSCIMCLDDKAYVGRASTEGGMVVVNLASLANPVDIRYLGDLTVARRNSLALLNRIRGTTDGIAVAPSPRFRINQLTLDEQPRVVGFTQLTPDTINLGPQGAALSDDGDYLFIGLKGTGEPTSSWRLTAFDVSDPINALTLGSITVGRKIQAVKVSGQTMSVLVLHGDATQVPMVSIYDFTDPYNPTLTGETEAYSNTTLGLSLEIY